MASNPTPPIIIMGVQGSGKSTIGALLAQRLGVPFVDGDDLHSDRNKQLMAAGHALTDTERMPWLKSVGERLAAGGGVVMACSALKRSYRDLLRSFAPRMITVYAHGDMALIHGRITARHHEYMPASLLQSQFDALEEREADEAGIDVDVAQSPETIVDAVLAFLSESVPVDAH